MAMQRACAGSQVEAFRRGPWLNNLRTCHYLDAYAGEMARRDENRRVSNSEPHLMIVGAVLT
jgi:hypothetical protein